MRAITGITVFSGMLGVTLFGLFLTPVFFVALCSLVERGGRRVRTRSMDIAHAHA